MMIKVLFLLMACAFSACSDHKGRCKQISETSTEKAESAHLDEPTEKQD